MQQTPLAVFTCRTNSHPFQERQISVHEPVKIGRAVARVKPVQSNAIFDCRVLSRNHALMWYENGKFYLQDTKSSNGTFVNKQRLSKASEESSPQEMSSGDTIQFGVDVMENSRTRGEHIVTHSCIIATVQLFHPDGTEARRDFSPFSQLPGGVAVQSQELYQLSQYLQEALHREQMLENKLTTLQRLVENTQDASEAGWQALVDEERLLSKLEVLQNQLQVYSKNQTEDSLRQELTALQEDKYNYENTAKESLRKVLEEKLEAVRKLSELERSLGNKEDECQHLGQMCESSQKNLEELAEKHQEQLQELASLHEQLEEAGQAHKLEMETLNNEKQELCSKLQDMIKQENVLQAKVESLQADNDFTKEQLTNMRAKMHSIKDTSHDSLLIPELISQGVQVQMVNLLDLQHSGQSSSSDSDSEKHDNDVEMKDSCAKEAADALADLDFELDSEDMDEEEEDSLNEKQLTDSLDELCELASNPPEPDAHLDADQSAPTSSGFDQSYSSEFTDTLKPEKLHDTQAAIEHYKKLLRESESKQQESKAKIKHLQNELQTVKAASCSYVQQISGLEVSLSQSESQLSGMVEQTNQHLRVQLEESAKQRQSHVILTTDLQKEIKHLEGELAQQSGEGVTGVTGVTEGTDGSDNTVCDATLKRELCAVKELLHEARTELAAKKQHVSTLEGRIEAANTRSLTAQTETGSLQAHVCKVTDEVKLKSLHVHELQEQLNRAEFTTKEVKEQILVLRDRMVEEQRSADVAPALQQQLEQSKKTADIAKQETETLIARVQELESARSVRASPLRADARLQAPPLCTDARLQAPPLCTAAVRSLPPNTESGRRDGSPHESPVLPPMHAVDSPVLPPMHAVDSSTPKSDGLAALREECVGLKQRIQVLEDQMKISRLMNSSLKLEKSMLQESFDGVKAIKDSLELQLNRTDAQKTNDKTTHELMESRDELARLHDELGACREAMVQRDTAMGDERLHHCQELNHLSHRARMVSLVSAVPVILLFIAIVMAFEPFLSTITATTPR